MSWEKFWEAIWNENFLASTAANIALGTIPTVVGIALAYHALVKTLREDRLLVVEQARAQRRADAAHLLGAQALDTYEVVCKAVEARHQRNRDVRTDTAVYAALDELYRIARLPEVRTALPRLRTTQCVGAVRTVWADAYAVDRMDEQAQHPHINIFPATDRIHDMGRGLMGWDGFGELPEKVPQGPTYEEALALGAHLFGSTPPRRRMRWLRRTGR